MSPISTLALRLGRVAALALLAAALSGTPQDGAYAQSTAGLTDAQRALVEQADYWSRRGRADLAARALDRLLASDPNNAEALLQYGLVELRRDQPEAAGQWLQRLRQSHPGDAQRITRLSRAIQVGDAGDPQLEQPRVLAQQGNFAEAAEAYQRAFEGEAPPDDIALEYWETLAGTEGGHPRAIRGLEELAARTGDPAVEVVLARVKTYRERTRREGVTELEALSRNPSVSRDALAGWRQGLIWLDGRSPDIVRYQRYLDQYPGDLEVRARLDEVRETVAAIAAGQRQARTAGGGGPTAPDRFTQARIDGFALLEQGDLAGAEQRFQFVLNNRSRDRDALGGLGTIRLRQDRLQEARDLLRRAVTGSRSAASRWGDAYRAARFYAGIEDANAATAAGNDARAEEILTGLLRNQPVDVALARTLLGDALFRQDKLSAAEDAYSAARAADPDRIEAIVGLFNVYDAQGRGAEALALADTLLPQDRDQIVGYDRVRAGLLRVRARELARVGEREGAWRAYQEAIVGDPNNPWLRLDFARFLVELGQTEQAHMLIDPLVTTVPADDAGLEAAALFYSELGMWADSLYVIERILADRRTTDQVALRERVLIQSEIQRALALAEGGAAREAERVLEGLYARPGRTPGEIGQIASALADIGKQGRALQIVRQSITRAGTDAPPALYLQYISSLIGTGNEAEAGAYLRQIAQRSDLTTQDRRELAQLEGGLAIQQADRARNAGRFADAYDILYPHLAARPDDPELLMSLARLYSTADQPREAQILYAMVLDADPGNLEAIRGAVGSAIEARDMDQAAVLLQDGLRYHPNEPRLYFLMGEVARAQGDTNTAVSALETARLLHEQRLATQAAAVNPAVPSLPPNPFVGMGGPRTTPFPYGRAVDQGITAPAPVLPYGNPFQSGSLEGGEATARLFGSERRDSLDVTRDLNLAQLNPLPPRPGGPAPIDPYAPPLYQPLFVNPVARPVAQDSLTRDIESSLKELRRDTGSLFQAGASIRARDGDGGLDRLIDVRTPMEYSFSPSGVGSVRLGVTPTFISSGSIGAAAADIRRFGTNTVLATPLDPGDQDDAGVGGHIGFGYGSFDVDAGVTPLGFRINNFVGGMTFAPRLSEVAGVSVRIERRAITDSLLSYAGAEDPASGQVWGGVTRTGGRIDLDVDSGRVGGYVGGGFYFVDGQDTDENKVAEATVGGFYRAIDLPDRELKVGINFTYFGYDNNRRYFTFGHGGYFSPQSYVAFAVPVEYTQEEGPFSFLVGGAIGIAHFNEDTVAYFPNNAGLQAQAVAAQVTDPTIDVLHQGQSATNVGFNLHGQIEYQLDDLTSLGASAAFDAAADFFEGTTMFYVKRAIGQ